ncbi:hypothetical protein RAA17_04070 [Komagataeibacter rhaeticus]|nr:hypothetical protein [Komagataeibacter rhaeticus]
MAEKALDVTGQWDGQFSYPHALPPEFFSASLFETADGLGGTVTERAANGQGRRALSQPSGACAMGPACGLPKPTKVAADSTPCCIMVC